MEGDKSKYIFNEVRTIKDHERSISSLYYSPNGQFLASSSADKTARVFSTTSNYECTSILKGATRGLSDLSWSPDSNVLATGSDDTILRVYDPTNSDPVLSLNGHLSYIFCVEFGPTGGLIATGSFDESVRLWDARSGKCIRTIAAHADPVTGISFSPDGTLFVSSSYDGLIRVWDTNSGKCLKTIVEDDNPPVSSVQFSKNGKFILSSNLDSTIRLWNLSSGKCIKSLVGHVNDKLCIVPSFLVNDKDDSTVDILAGSEDGKVIIWDLNSRSIIGDQVIFENSPVMAVDVHPCERLIATASIEPDSNVIKLYSF